MSKEELAEQAYKLAFEYEAKLGSCPQCVFAAVKETLSIGDEKTFKAADALAGGGALSTNGTCGALVGGMLAIGSIVGRNYEDFKNGRRVRNVFKYAKKLYDRFVEEFGSCLCKDVQRKIFGRSYNLLDPKDYEEFEKAGAHVDKCPNVSGKVAKWCVEIILEEKLKEI